MRAIIIVLDSAGIGELPDAEAYGDRGSNTLGHTAEAVGGLDVPNLQALGLGNIAPILGVDYTATPKACYGKMAEKSVGKDTTTGHWELAGIVVERPFPTYPDGFPPEVIQAFEKATGRSTIGNYPASGTAIIEQLGDEHFRTGKPIVYTSADSVFQIACHKQIVPIDELYEMCRIARRLLVSPHSVARVIARPFDGPPGAFSRTEKRRDFSIEPPRPTLLDRVAESGREVVAVGKIEDVFANRGVTRSIHSLNNAESIDAILDAMSSTGSGLIFANLIDFDMWYGHRNDPVGFARALAEFDAALPAILSAANDDDLIMITADHGCDPTSPGADHTREYVPILAYSRRLALGKSLGIRDTFADVQATILDAMGLGPWEVGASFWEVSGYGEFT